MIDGVKIELLNYDFNTWLNNSLLDFTVKVNYRTGEVLKGYCAKYQTLIFEIKQSEKHKNKYNCSIRGSLHKYWNEGKNNNNDFTIEELNKCIIQLSNAFGFEPNKAILHGIEAGVNIKTPISANEVLKSLVSDGLNEFCTFSDNTGKRIGKALINQRYKLKIYNKGKQSGTRINNLLRVEIAINKMEHLKNYDITTLADLQNKTKVNKLITPLLKQWDKIIYWDKKINSRLLSQFEQTKYQSYGNYRNWTDYNKTQRARNRKYYNKLIEKAGTQHDFKTLRSLIIDKWEQLGNCKTSYDTIKNTLPEPVKKECKNPKCSHSINHKKSIAKYCSKQCNNVVNGLKRTKRLQRQKDYENNALNSLLPKINKGNLWMSVCYYNDDFNKQNTYSDYLHQSEIQPEKEFIKQVFKIVIEPPRKNGKQTILAGTRARKLIRTLRNYNKKSPV